MKVGKLYEYRLDRWDPDTEILEIYDKYFVGLYPHLITQLTKRCKKFDHKLLKLPITRDAILDCIWSDCSSAFGQLADLRISKQSIKGLYTQIRPVNIKDKRGKSKTTVNVELTIMFNISQPAFEDDKLFKRIWDMRYERYTRYERDQFLLDHACDEWKKYLIDGSIREGVLGVFLESAVVVVSDESTYPVSWTDVRTGIPRVEKKFPAVDMELSAFQKMWYSLVSDESKSKVQSKLSATNIIKLGLNK